jgi:hypothetical protein
MLDEKMVQAQGERALLEAKLRLEARAKTGSGWFYWIAGLSFLNSLSVLLGGQLTFLFGLAITQVVDGISLGIQSNAGLEGVNFVSLIAFGLNFMAALVVGAFGYFARKGNQSAYVVGMALYALDTLVTLLFQDWLGFLFHLLALAGLWGGFRAFRKLLPVQTGIAPLQTLREEVVTPEQQDRSKRRIAILIALIGVVLALAFITATLQAR